MNKMILPDLKGIPQTLLLPLIGRAVFSHQSYSPICDDKAIELVNSIDYDFDKLLKNKNVSKSTLFWLARAYHFDQAIKKYLKKYPDAVIVNMGCGLDTSFHRVDNGKLTWIDIDLPNVIELRKQWLSPSHREHAIEKSILDHSWMSEVKQYGDHVLFFAGGLFMYFTETEVKSLLKTMAKQFPGAYLLFDNIYPKEMKKANVMLRKSNMEDALLQWSLQDARQLEAWSSIITVVSQQGYFTNMKNKYRFPLGYQMIMCFFELVHKSGIIELQFSRR